MASTTFCFRRTAIRLHSRSYRHLFAPPVLWPCSTPCCWQCRLLTPLRTLHCGRPLFAVLPRKTSLTVLCITCEPASSSCTAVRTRHRSTRRLQSAILSIFSAQRGPNEPIITYTIRFQQSYQELLDMDPTARLSDTMLKLNHHKGLNDISFMTALYDADGDGTLSFPESDYYINLSVRPLGSWGIGLRFALRGRGHP